MEKFEELISKCKCGVHLTVNSHRDVYLSLEEYFNHYPNLTEDLTDIDSEVFQKMKELDTMIELQFYPHTPIGFYKVYHYDLTKAVEEALNSLK